ncbi:MAG: flagellar biosynthesis anti-sigma factor FlgM [Rhodanobacteraceae bacterium]
MNTTINPGGPTVPQPATSSSKSATGEAAGTAAGQVAANPTRGGDHVQLTESARAIAAARGTDAPVDTQRVEHIRQAIADGSYKVDAQRVADRLIGMEKQIR